MTVYGYARVSTKGQSLSDQIDQLKKDGVEKSNIYSEKFTGTTTKRPEFLKLESVVQSGDIIVVTKLDRFARNTQEAIATKEALEKQGVSLRVLQIGGDTVDTSTPTGKFMFNVLSAVADMERDMIIDRTQAGKEYAKAHKPNYREGRPKRAITPHYQAIYDYLKDHSYVETGKAFDVSKATIYRIKKQIESE